MKRLLSISLVGISVLAGYSIREPKVSADVLHLPYSVGDSVRLEYPDGMTRAVCVIERFYDSFVSCKVPSPSFAAPDAPTKIVYNLDTVVAIQLVKKAD